MRCIRVAMLFAFVLVVWVSGFLSVDLAEAGRWKVGTGGTCYWDANDNGPNQCDPNAPPPTGRYKWSGWHCYWEPNDSGPNQCDPSTTEVGEATDDVGTGQSAEISDGSGGIWEAPDSSINVAAPSNWYGEAALYANPVPPPNTPLFGANTSSTLKTTVVAWQGVPGQSPILPYLPLILDVYAVPYGHSHGGMPIPKIGNMFPTSGPNRYNCNTGPTGRSCRIELKLNRASMAVVVSAWDTISGRAFYAGWVNVSPFGGQPLPRRLEEYGCTPGPTGCVGGYFALVGATSTHPDNHWCQAFFCDKLMQVAYEYAVRYPGLILAYNDVSLVRGGLFDYAANWTDYPGHVRHRTGKDADLRTNCTGPYSVPCPELRTINEIRRWLIDRYTAVMGRQPAYHGSGDNRHLHIYHN
jgi:hypothetical protein